MKKLILLFILIGNSVLYAQNGLFIQTMIGAGVSSITIYHPEFHFKDVHKFTLSPQLLIGYKYHNLIFKTGITYLKTGYTGNVNQDPFYTFVDPFGPVPFTEYQYYNYLTIPLSVAYNIRVSPRLSIAPGISYSLGFLQSTESSIVMDYSPSPASSYHATDEFMIKRQASGSNSFAGIQVEADYKINSNFFISAGPEAQYKFSPSFPDNTDFFRPYTYTFNVGAKYYFVQKHAESIIQSK